MESVMESSTIMGYSAFAIILWSLLFIVLSRKRGFDFFRPVIYGFLLGILAYFFGAGIFGLLIGGMLSGYLISKKGSKSLEGFRGGGLVGLLIDSSTMLSVGLIMTFKDPWIDSLGQLCSAISFVVFRDIVFGGLGGMIGWIIGGSGRPPRGAEQTS
jgi:hypothetical protein